MAIDVLYGTVGALLAAEPDVGFDTILDVEHLPAWNAAIHAVVKTPRGPLVEDAEWIVQERSPNFTRCHSSSRAAVVDRGKRRFEYTSRPVDLTSYVMWAWDVRADVRGSELTVVCAAYPPSSWQHNRLARFRARHVETELRRSLGSLERYLGRRKLDDGRRYSG
jgi:hypothetical protein